MRPPKAPKRPKELTTHGHTRVDPYYWIRDDERASPDVLEVLNAENAYTEHVTAPWRGFRDALYDEIVGRIKKDDTTVPYRYRDFEYQVRFEADREYPTLVRWPVDDPSAVEVMLDGNVRAEGHPYYAFGGFALSASQQLLAFAEDVVGRRQYRIRVKNLESGEFLDDEIVDVSPQVEWADDDETVFYIKNRPDTLLAYQVCAHRLGADPATDRVVYEEPDDTFYLGMAKTRSETYLGIYSHSTLSSEARFVSRIDPEADPIVFLERESDHEYDVDHFDGRFYVRTNWQAKNFRLMSADDVEVGDRDAWVEVVPHRDDVFLDDVTLFDEYLVCEETRDGLAHFRVIRWDDGSAYDVDFGEPAYTAHVGRNPHADTTRLRYQYTSLTTPNSVIEIDLATRERSILKEEEVVGAFDRTAYTTERRWVTARDGARVPVSIVYRNGFERGGDHPLMVYAYGSYGANSYAAFNSARLSLLDRGFVYAVAHVRGGQELGRAWYEGGKLMTKMNTFTDFIDVTESLVSEGYGHREKVFAMGGSAGGLLIGAVANLRPDLYTGLVAHVPFVDVVTTMLDDSIPLTTGEYDEWGNPNEKPAYDYMLSYSPYDQVEARAYPNMLVTGGLHDSQVQYWEPAKWVAKLRDLKTDDNLLLLHMNMDAGHGGQSGRFRRQRETALEYAFLCALAGVAEIG